MGIFSEEAAVVFIICFVLRWRSTERKEFVPKRAFFSCKNRLHFKRVTSSVKANWKSRNLFSLWKKERKKCADVYEYTSMIFIGVGRGRE